VDQDRSSRLTRCHGGAFEKKTRKTTARDLEIGRERFRSLVAMRRKNDGSKSDVRVTESSGNVFRDLGFPREEAEHLLVRADL
jgi:hypothetical protein